MRPKIVLLYLGDNLELMKKAPEIYEKIEQVKIDFGTGDVIDPCFVRLHVDYDPDVNYVKACITNALNSVFQDYGGIDKIYINATHSDMISSFLDITENLNVGKNLMLYENGEYIQSFSLNKETSNE